MISTAQDIVKKDSLIVTPPKKLSLHEYVLLYKDIAIREMERSGIPASITLAQGIHESGCGNSRLATEANNHFGIKCHKGWEGQTYYQWDDDPQESCFRVYENAESSYIDHTDFLRTRDRYAFCFDYDKTDYEKWAKGLKKAGYATDPKYPDKLIGTIERHKLNQYDLVMSPMVIPDSEDTTYQPIIDKEIEKVYVKPEYVQRALRKKPRSFLFPKYKKGLFRQNGSTYAHARQNETALEFATRFDIPYRKFLKFNDLIDGDRLIDYQYCYIQPKKTRFKGEVEYYRVKDDVGMYEIAQYYGIRLDLLLERNLLVEGQEPRNGELILLNEKVSVAPALRLSSGDAELPIDSTTFYDPVYPPKHIPEKKDSAKTTPIPQPPLRIDQPTYPDSIYNPNNTINTTENPNNNPAPIIIEEDDANWIEKMEAEIKRKEEEEARKALFPEFPDEENLLKIEQPVEKERETIVTPKVEPIVDPIVEPISEADHRLHKVRAKETLFGLQRQYGVNWQRIKAYNDLQTDVIHENQILKIPRK